MSKIVEYTTPNNIGICIDKENGRITCTNEDSNDTENKIVYEYIDVLLKSPSSPIGIRLEPLFVCFKTEDNNMEMFKTDGNRSDNIFIQDDIREEHISIVRDKELMYDISLILDNGGIAYLQYVSSMMYSGYVIVYASYEDTLYQSVGDSSFIIDKMIEFYSTPNGFMPSIDYSKMKGIMYNDIGGTISRKVLSFKDCYECTKRENIKDYEYLILKKDYLNIRRMTESIRDASVMLIDIFERNINDKYEIRNELFKNGLTPFIKYHKMSIDYVLNQLDNMFTNDIETLRFVLSSLNSKVEGL